MMFYARDTSSVILVVKAAFLVVPFIAVITEAQSTIIIQESPVILLHNDPQTLCEIVAGNYTSTNIRLSLVCAAYGEPDYPIITWSSPIDGVEDYSTLAVNDSSINIVTDQQLLSSLRVTVSTLELCDVRPENLTEYYCEAVNSNSPDQQNMSLFRASLGAFGVTYSFASGNVEVALLYYEEDLPTTTPTSCSMNPPSQHRPSEGPSTTSTLQPQSDSALNSTVVAITSILVVCILVFSAAVLASTVTVIMCKSANKGSRERTRNLAFHHRAQTDDDSLYAYTLYTTTTTTSQQQASRKNRQQQTQSDTDSMYECTAYGGHNQPSQEEELTHTYNYIDTPTSPKDKKMVQVAETFAVYQCPAYGAKDVAIPREDLAMGRSGITETGETVYNYVENSITM